MTHKMAAVCACAVLLGGCSSVNVVKNPSQSDNGIRFYRPKPYLMVTPADPTGRMVKLELLELPDYCEEYSIHPKGKKPPAVVLKDGWNLVAVGSPAPPPPAPPAPAPVPPEALKLPDAVLVAGNVPIGLYESVFDVAGPAKFLKGWRYVGFNPWGGGPAGSGTDAQAMCSLRNGNSPCVAPGGGSAMPGPLFGLVFFNGAMTFRQLDEIANNMTCPEYIKPPIQGAVVTPPTTGATPIGPTGGPTIEAVPATPAPATPTPTPATPTPNPTSETTTTPRSTTYATPSYYGSSMATYTAASPATTAPRYNATPTAAYPVDSRVSQTSASTKATAPKASTPKATATAVKSVDPKKLEALEAEVFKSLNYSPAGTKAKSSKAATAATAKAGDSMVPELTPAASNR